MTSTIARPAGRQVLPQAPGGTVPNGPSMGLAAEHFGAAMLYLVAGGIGLVWIAPQLAAGAYLAPPVAAVTHLFTLGWLTMTIFGALNQLLPVALGAPIRSVEVGHASFWSFAPGVGLFAAGIATSSDSLRHAGMALVTAGIVLAAGNIVATLARARLRDVTWAAVALAITFLVSTLALGLVLLHNLHTGFIAEARVRVLAAHLHLAIAGWALVMMTGVSHRLLPMFLLSHNADTRWSKRALGFLASGVTVLVIGLLLRQAAITWLGALLLSAGVGCFLRQAFAFYRARVKRGVDVGMRFAAVALVFLAVSVPAGFVLLVEGIASPRLATAYVTTALLGGIVLYVTGFFYKIVPLLAWTVRFRGRVGKETVPTVAELFSSRVAQAQLVMMVAGVTLLGGGILTGSLPVTRCGAVLFLGGILMFMSQIGRVALGGRAWRR